MFGLFVIIALIVLLFFITRSLVMLWTGCTAEEAAKKIQEFVSQKKNYHLAEDQILVSDLCEDLKNVIGDVRYQELCKLAKSCTILNFGYASGLPYIAITVNYIDENEKVRLQNVLANRISSFLTIHHLPKQLLLDWKTNGHLCLPALMIRYAETEEERKILEACLTEEDLKIIKKYQPLMEEGLLL